MLLALETIFRWADARQKELKTLERALARVHWTLREARKLIPDDKWKELMIQHQVNRMDPDFQFPDENGKRPEPLAEHLARIAR